MRAIIATDMSDASLLTAETLAGCNPALFERVTFLHVVDLDAYTAGGSVPGIVEFAEKRLAEESARLIAQGIPADHRVERGRAAETVARVATELGADLIAVTDRGSGRAAGRIVGSVAEKIAAATTLPVFVERVEERDGAWCRLGAASPFSRPLVAADLDDGLRSLIAAVSVLPGLETACFVHALRPGHDIEEAYDFIAGHLGDTPLLDARIVVIPEGDPVEAIVSQSLECSATAIVVAHRHRGVLGRALLGSIASKVLERSTLPVVLA